MGFDYPYTCPKIDMAIGAAKDAMADLLKDMLQEVCPLLGEWEAKRAAGSWAERLYDGIEDAFETVRSTNEDMRADAESQIEKLERELANAEAELGEAA